MGARLQASTNAIRDASCTRRVVQAQYTVSEFNNLNDEVGFCIGIRSNQILGDRSMLYSTCGQTWIRGRDCLGQTAAAFLNPAVTVHGSRVFVGR